MYDYVNKCWCEPRYSDGNNSILSIYDKTRTVVGPRANLPLSPNRYNLPDNNDYVVDTVNDLISFQPGIYFITYTITARIPVAALTTIPLSIMVSRGGRDYMPLSASAYNNDNIATLSGSTMFPGGGRASLLLINNTRRPDLQYIQIELISFEITAHKLYALQRAID